MVFVNISNNLPNFKDKIFVIEKMTKICYTDFMHGVLLQLGLSDKQIVLYEMLLKTPHQTAQKLADATGIKRTNVYRLLDELEREELIVADDRKVKTFATSEPQALQKLLQRKQSVLKQTAGSLSAILPVLRSQYSLSIDRPGVVYMVGEDGLERLLLDMLHSKTEVLLVAGDEPQDETMLKRFRELIMQRKENGVPTRALFHDGDHRERITKKFAERGFVTRFLKTPPFDSEVVLYEDNVVFSVYDPTLITTIITNKDFARTMRTLFEQLWNASSI